ncbi:protein kinase domain-containing protein [Sinosporangium siamense]|uniref:non-specific serine/threonine protein kinase n=1 Tax=Sinosporangium siamense TaxID=1367973 RepID=A0A919V4K1_9ACTN|nr:protein kinase [Sinosporangium siamense]GII90588.1 hypothetical protein Ssi02_08190 [Sinosporangium siamense]
MNSRSGLPVVRGRYRLLSRLGQGGMADVWLADDQALHRRVALKQVVLDARSERLPVRRERAMREARALALIKDPGVVEIHDVFEEDGSPWIVMAVIEGRTLGEVLRDEFDKGGPDEREVARIGLRVLSTLRAAHSLDILHRDVKPANVMIGDNGGVYLIDFGIAQFGGEVALTRANAMLGTMAFTAPERIEGHPPGPPADLWSLGVTLFYALEGYSPFERSDSTATMRAVLDLDPPRAKRPGPLADAVVRLLHKDPAQRMKAWELDRALTSIADGVPREEDGVPRREARMRSSATTVPRPPKRDRTPPPPKPPKLDTRDPARIARRAGEMSPAGAAQLLAGLTPGAVQAALTHLEPKPAAAILLALPPDMAASVIAAMPAKAAGALVNEMAARPSETVAVLQVLSARRVGGIMDHMRARDSAALLGAMPVEEAKRFLQHADVRTSAGVIGALGTTRIAVDVVEALPAERACAVLNHVPPGFTAGLLKAMSKGRANVLFNGLSQQMRDQVRQAVSRR